MLCDWRSELFEHLCLEMWWATWILKAYAITSYADFNDRFMASAKDKCLSMPYDKSQECFQTVKQAFVAESKQF